MTNPAHELGLVVHNHSRRVARSHIAEGETRIAEVTDVRDDGVTIDFGDHDLDDGAVSWLDTVDVATLEEGDLLVVVQVRHAYVVLGRIGQEADDLR